LARNREETMELNVPKPNRFYEAVIILHPDTAEADQKAIFKKYQEIIKSFDGEITNIDTWGKRRLANPIEKITVGTYFHLMFEAKAECVAEIERTLKINDKVLRYNHMKLDERKTLAKHLEEFRTIIADSNKRLEEAEQARQRRQSRRRP